MLTLLSQIKLVQNISCLRIDLIWTNAKNARHQGGNFDKCPAKKTNKQTNKQNATILHLQYLLAKIFFQNRSYAHMVDGCHPNILLSAFKLGPLTLFLNWNFTLTFHRPKDSSTITLVFLWAVLVCSCAAVDGEGYGIIR